MAVVALMIDATRLVMVPKTAARPFADEVPDTVDEPALRVPAVALASVAVLAKSSVDDATCAKRLVVVADVMVARVALRSVSEIGFAVVKVPET